MEDLGGCDLLARLLIDFVSYESFQSPDIDGFIQFSAIADSLASVIADPAANPGEGVIHLDNTVSIFPASFPDQCNIALGTLTSRAGVPAGSDPGLGDGISIRYGLRILFINCVALNKVFIKDIYHFNRADINTIVAGYTVIKIDVARSCLDPG